MANVRLELTNLTALFSKNSVFSISPISQLESLKLTYEVEVLSVFVPVVRHHREFIV